ncbi:MAG: hypothetical protein U0175_26840 [Caldilineaceae bacterium]
MKRQKDRQLITEAKLKYQAVDTPSDESSTKRNSALLIHEVAWQEILAFVEQLEQRVVSGEPYQWSRVDGYDDQAL